MERFRIVLFYLALSLKTRPIETHEGRKISHSVFRNVILFTTFNSLQFLVFFSVRSGWAPGEFEKPASTVEHGHLLEDRVRLYNSHHLLTNRD